jgi:two-component system sensor histidine kinase BaeS
MIQPASERRHRAVPALQPGELRKRRKAFYLPRLVTSLRAKLLISYLVIILVGVFTLTIAADTIAPGLFSHMLGRLGPVSGMKGTDKDVLTAMLMATFRGAMLLALLIAAMAALLAAIATSLYVSGRIVAPVQRMLLISQRIAAGRYSDRVPVLTRDELGDLSASFNRMAEQLESIEKRRIELMSDIAHELRTPLTSIEGYMEGLLDHVIEPSDETFVLIAGEARRLRRLVDDLQELSRAESNQLSIAIHPVSLAEILEAAVARLRPQFVEREVALDLVLDRGRDLQVLADEDRTGQVLLNLLSNALRYTPVHGNVQVSAWPEGSVVHIAVSDTGIGLSPEDRERIFDRFYRVDKSRTRSGGGSGIGLTIARALVEAQGGHIWAESAGLGQGSTFHFTLPAVVSEMPAAKENKGE